MIPFGSTLSDSCHERGTPAAITKICSMNSRFIYRHWLTTLLLATLLHLLYTVLFDRPTTQHSGWLEWYPFMFLFGFIYSIPTLAVYISAFFLLKKLGTEPLLAKAWLIGIAVAGIFITQLLLFNSRPEKEFLFPFLAASVAAGLFFKIEKRLPSANAEVKN